MILGLFGKNKREKALSEQQYGYLTSAARDPEFYRQANVPDTVMGRFEMLSAILILYFRAAGRTNDAARAVAQNIVESFFEDLDHSMRELGIGDHGVPKRMKKMASMFYGRIDSYGKALDDRDEKALAAALKRNFHPEIEDPTLSMSVLAHYMLQTEASLSDVASTVLEEGALRMPTLERREET